MTGTIKSLPLDKKFGFIAREGGAKDLFFHFDELVGVTPEELKVGDMLSFEVVTTGDRTSAAKVSRA